MGLEQRQKWALECFFPGLIEKLQALGAGEFERQPPAFRPRGEGIGFADLRVRYYLEGKPAMYVELFVQLKLKADRTPLCPSTPKVDLGDWDRKYYALSYKQKLGDRVFAFDYSSRGRHVHMRPDVTEHIPVDEVDPDSTDFDPRDFVDLVARFRNESIYPLKRGKKKRNK